MCLACLAFDNVEISGLIAWPCLTFVVQALMHHQNATSRYLIADTLDYAGAFTALLV